MRYCIYDEVFEKTLLIFLIFLKKYFFGVIDISICKDTTDFRITAGVLNLIDGCRDTTALQSHLEKQHNNRDLCV